MRVIQALLFTVAATIVFAAFADTAVIDGITWSYSITNGEAVLERPAISTTVQGVVSVPSQLSGFPVRTIRGSVFASCRGITSVVIPDGVSNIEVNAFYDCESLKSIRIPQSVRYIQPGIPGSGAVGILGGSCPNFTSFDVDVANKDYSSVDGALYDKNQRNLIIFPRALENASFSSAVTNIGPYAFEKCVNIQSITIPHGVLSIGGYAFSGCSFLSTVAIPSSVRHISEFAFYKCKSLVSVKIPDSVTSLEAGLFWDCSSLNSVEIPHSVTNIGADCFHTCRALNVLTIPYSVVNFEGEPFYWSYPTVYFEGKPPRSAGDAVENLYSFYYNSAYSTEWNTVIRQNGLIHGYPYTPEIQADADRIAVEFYPLGGQTTEVSVSYTNNETYGQLPWAWRNEYTFLGWFTEEETGERINSTMVVRPNVNKLYAHWQPSTDTTATQTNYVVAVITNWIDSVRTINVTNTFERMVVCTNWIDGIPQGLTKVSEGISGFVPNAYEDSFDGSMKRIWSGIVIDGAGDLVGLVQLSLAKATSRGVRVSGYLMLADGKKQSLKSSYGVEEDGCLAVSTTVGKLGVAEIVIGSDGFRGVVGDYTIISAQTTEDAGVIKGYLTLTYFDPKTSKQKTRRITVNGTTADGVASGTLIEKGKSDKRFVTEVELEQ